MGARRRLQAGCSLSGRSTRNTITSNSGTSRGHSKTDVYTNEPPSVTVEAGASSVEVGQSLTLIATLLDDELPVEPPSP